ncbi:hypothetical protein [Luteimonas deserti]|uniref:Uncharacterized protein n=1 Tax=Luteimonas deserti TaxID=2752306 RepID=A0A7Z0QPX3_9GAMM|nr:hypothetical protein [Luteimonas deserti]NYZ62009.1 hypothetical protein [Luteimonas deserti]
MPIISFKQVLNEYNAALTLLSGYGLRVKSTRLADYRRVITRAMSDENEGRDFSSRRPEIVNALNEAAEIAEIAKLNPAHLRDREVVRKLKLISGGRPVMAAEGADQARDYSLEFTTAVALQQENSFGGFSTHGGDLTIGEAKNPAECKRISSLSSLPKRLRDVREQLIALGEAGNPPGLIVLDLTRPIRIEQGMIKADSDDDFGKQAEQRLLAYLDNHVMTLSNVLALIHPNVLGIVARCISTGIAGDATNIRQAVIWQACTIHEDGSTEDMLFRNLARGFGPGELREGSKEDIDEASARIIVAPRRGKRER